jgi:hypothetical protein
MLAPVRLPIDTTFVIDIRGDKEAALPDPEIMMRLINRMNIETDKILMTFVPRLVLLLAQ